MRTVTIMILAVLAAGLLQAQADVAYAYEAERRVEIFEAAVPPPDAPHEGTFHFIAAGPGFEGKIVKNAPFSAEGVTETVRTLADGTKINQKNSSKIYRDSEGRTRREIQIGGVGPLAPAGEGAATVTINNPVAGEIYVLNSQKKTARKIKFSEEVKVVPHGVPGGVGHGVAGGVARGVSGGVGGAAAHEPQNVALVQAPATAVWIERRVAGGAEVTSDHAIGFPGNRVVMSHGGPDAKHEQLGERNIEGVLAKGTRVTNTIPAGKIGNDRPITMVHERWYSEELQTVVLTESKDPMAGDITYRLAGIQRGNPPAALFEIPPDYKVEEGENEILRKVQIMEQMEQKR